MEKTTTTQEHNATLTLEYVPPSLSFNNWLYSYEKKTTLEHNATSIVE
jgi:hypothetical protein